MGVSRGYSATKDQLINRLHRVEGQVRGVAGMVDDDRACIDLLTQIAAIHAALDKVALGLLDGHIRQQIAHAGEAGANGEEMADDVIAVVGRLIGRG